MNKVLVSLKGYNHRLRCTQLKHFELQDMANTCVQLGETKTLVLRIITSSQES